MHTPCVVCTLAAALHAAYHACRRRSLRQFVSGISTPAHMYVWFPRMQYLREFQLLWRLKRTEFSLAAVWSSLKCEVERTLARLAPESEGGRVWCCVWGGTWTAAYTLGTCILAACSPTQQKTTRVGVSALSAMAAHCRVLKWLASPLLQEHLHKNLLCTTSCTPFPLHTCPAPSPHPPFLQAPGLQRRWCAGACA
jgi:hypothetical protein